MPEQRMLRGEWRTPEIQKAVAIGYTLVTIHKVHHFPPDQCKVGLFADYVNTWQKIKQEAARYPSWAIPLKTKYAMFTNTIRKKPSHSSPLEKSWMQSYGQTHAQQLLG